MGSFNSDSVRTLKSLFSDHRDVRFFATIIFYSTVPWPWIHRVAAAWLNCFHETTAGQRGQYQRYWIKNVNRECMYRYINAFDIFIQTGNIFRIWKHQWTVRVLSVWKKSRVSKMSHNITSCLMSMWFISSKASEWFFLHYIMKIIQLDGFGNLAT